MTLPKSAADPYKDRKTYHKADKVSSAGKISALCYAPRHRAIPAGRGQTWTFHDDAVTCPKCLKIIEERRAENARASRMEI